VHDGTADTHGDGPAKQGACWIAAVRKFVLQRRPASAGDVAEVSDQGEVRIAAIMLA
jgi:hypothetical protein